MARDTLLGFPAHTLPYRRGESLLYRQTHMAFQHCRKAISYEQI